MGGLQSEALWSGCLKVFALSLVIFPVLVPEHLALSGPQFLSTQSWEHFPPGSNLDSVFTISNMLYHCLFTWQYIVLAHVKGKYNFYLLLEERIPCVVHTNIPSKCFIIFLKIRQLVFQMILLILFRSPGWILIAITCFQVFNWYLGNLEGYLDVLGTY